MVKLGRQLAEEEPEEQSSKPSLQHSLTVINTDDGKQPGWWGSLRGSLMRGTASGAAKNWAQGETDIKTLSAEMDLADVRNEIDQERLNDSISRVISENSKFQNFTLGVIVMNALWIGVDIEWNHVKIPTDDGSLPLEPYSTVVENLFCTYFTVEVVLRFLSFRKTKFCLFDGWFVFDTILVFFMVLETWVLKIAEAAGGGAGSGFLANFSALRLLRLLRLTRMARIMQAVPELMMLVKGMISATKSVSFIFLFLILVMYVFSIILMSMMAAPCEEIEDWVCAEVGGEYKCESKLITCDWAAKVDDLGDDAPFSIVRKNRFGSMGDSMMTLFTNGVLGDNLNWCCQIILLNGSGLVEFWVFFTFYTISACTLLNMLIGVLCEVITRKADEERETMRDTEMRYCLGEAFTSMDSNQDGHVTATEWELMKQNPAVRRSLTSNGIEPDVLDEQMEKMQIAIFNQDKNYAKVGRAGSTQGLTLEEFTNKLLEIQPSKPASTLELQILQSKCDAKFDMRSLELDALEGAMATLLASRGIKFNDPDRIKNKLAPGKNNANLMKLPTQQLLAILKARTSAEPPRAQMVDTASSALVLESAFPTPDAREPADINDPDSSTGILNEDRVLAQQHPFFQKLAQRQLTATFPGGWAAARFVAAQLENNRMTLQALSHLCGSALSVSDLQNLMDAAPELFVKDGCDGTVAVSQLEEHVHGCPRHTSCKTPTQDNECQCVWRLCDALAPMNNA